MKSVLILVIVLKMRIVVQEIIVAFVPAEKATQEIHMAINAPLVSQIFYAIFKCRMLINKLFSYFWIIIFILIL